MSKYLIFLIILFLISCIPLPKEKPAIEAESEPVQQKAIISESISPQQELISYIQKVKNYPAYEVNYKTTSTLDKGINFVNKATLAVKNSAIITYQENYFILIEAEAEEIFDEQKQYERVDKLSYDKCAWSEDLWECDSKKISEEDYQKFYDKFQHTDLIQNIQNMSIERTSQPVQLGEEVQCFIVDKNLECYDKNSGFLAYSESQNIKNTLESYTLNPRSNLFTLQNTTIVSLVV
ncbi:hypothetical protein HYV79_01350 [Candidatus Woesearchaeota archaeon]|nr:hypothetical protein [Candidatus Woesearchaeota archaeon]